MSSVPPGAGHGGGRRVNSLPLVLLGGACILFLIIMGLVAADRANRSSGDDTEHHRRGPTTAYARNLVASRDGLIPPAAPPEPPPVLEPPKVLKPPVPEPAPIVEPAPQPKAEDNEVQRIRQAKLAMLEEAAKAKTGVSVVAPRSTGSRPSTSRRPWEGPDKDDPRAAYRSHIAELRQRIQGDVGGETGSAPAGSADQYTQFGGTSDRWTLDSGVEAPRSSYLLRAGSVIPATLISGINSDLPGQIVGQVSQPVFDTPTGNHILLPQGSRLVGTYSSDVEYAQSRVLVAWQRIVFPDGKALDIGAMPGADGAGYAGFADQVDHHYLRIFGSALLMSAIVGGISYSQRTASAGGYGYGAPNAVTILSQSLGQELGRAASQMLQKNLNVSPTIEIRPGFRLNVMVTKDLEFTKPYQAFDY